MGNIFAIRCPPKACTVYFNYKGFHSIVLITMVDADYKFLSDVGATGAGPDEAFFANADLKETLEDGTIG